MYKSNQNAKKVLEGVVGEHSPVENLLRQPSRENRKVKSRDSLVVGNYPRMHQNSHSIV